MVIVDLIVTLHKAHDRQKEAAIAVLPLDDLTAIVARVANERFSAVCTGTKDFSTSYLYLAIIRDCFQRHIDVELVSMERVVATLQRLGYRLDEPTQCWLPPVREDEIVSAVAGE